MKHACFLILLFLLASAVFAGNTDSVKVSLDLTTADINDAFTKLSQQAKVSIMGDSTVKGKVTCSLNNVTPEQALDIICKMNKLVWVKAYVSADPSVKQTPSEVFALMDTLKQLNGTTVVFEDPKSQKQTMFVREAEAGSIDMTALSGALNLKPVYMVRAEPEQVAKKTDAKNGDTNLTNPPTDPRIAASQVWDYFGKMSSEQRWEVMRQLRDLMFKTLTPEERDRLFHHERPPMPDENQRGRR